MALSPPVGLGIGAGVGILSALAARRLILGPDPRDQVTAPIPGGLATSGWMDPRPHRSGRHAGLDIRSPAGAAVRAVAAGEVVRVQRSPEGLAGRLVAVRHRLKGLGAVVSRYLHLDSVDVAAGQRVRAGQVIGASGTSGTSGRSPHLHLDLHACGDEVLSRWASLYGVPRGGFPTGGNVRGCIPVPAEPIIPVGGYAASVIQAARARGVPLRSSA